LTHAELPRLYSADDICQVTGISRRTLSRLISAGEFPEGTKLGAKRIWHPEDLEAHWKNSSQGKRSKPGR